MISRRALLRTSVGAIGTLAGTSALARALADVCRPTPKQTPGPFYPVADPVDKDADLTWVKGGSGPARGTVVIVEGMVRDLECKPVSGALVEIWQACETGKYDHPDDPNPAAKDPNFQYWGRSVTDASGRYRFKTIKPGAYPASKAWTRPPHIHFRVVKDGYRELITQMYFAGENLNDGDEILRRVPRPDRESVIIEFDPATGTGVFDLTIQRR